MQNRCFKFGTVTTKTKKFYCDVIEDYFLKGMANMHEHITIADSETSLFTAISQLEAHYLDVYVLLVENVAEPHHIGTTYSVSHIKEKPNNYIYKHPWAV